MQLHAIIPALLLGLAVAACSAASPAPDTGAAQDGAHAGHAEPAGEQLIGQPPRGWRQIGATNVVTLKRAVFIPEEEEAATWTRRITFEAMRDDPLPDPAGFVDTLALERDRDCGTFEKHLTFAGEENGYPTAVHLLVCHQDRKTKRSLITLMKTIRGNDAFYVISRSMRGAPIPRDGAAQMDETRIGGWAIYLKSITLCDTGRPDHPCPVSGSGG